MLDERSLLPIELSEVRSQEASLLTGRTRRVSVSKVGVLYEQLSDLLRAGVPMLRALKVLSEQASNPQLSQLLREVWGPGHTEQGHYLRIYMRQLRSKIEQDSTQPRWLLTEPGIGYRLASE